MENIGSRLREERERLKMTQEAFATACGVQRQAQSKYESNVRSPDVNYLAAAAEIGIDVAYVICGNKIEEKGSIEHPAAVALPLDIDLWSSDQIAAYLKKDRRKVMERVVCLPDFPKAIRLPAVNGGKQHPLWKAREVIKWAESYQER